MAMTTSPRPFYTEYAWAFDLLIDRPVGRECGQIVDWLIERGTVPGATLLDAGCGTGRYAAELARRGYVVEGVDRSPELIAVARHAAADRRIAVSFRIGDLLDLPSARYDGILCRGVLNDILDDDRRQRVFSGFARAMRPDGVLILDVREWAATRARKAREPLFRKSVDTSRGRLTFSSYTELEPDHQQLLLSETHVLVGDEGEHSSEYRFVMRCWTRGELDAALARGGFDAVAHHGAYDRAVPAGVTDRLVVIAQLRPADRDRHDR